MNEEEMFNEFKQFFVDLFEKYFGSHNVVPAPSVPPVVTAPSPPAPAPVQDVHDAPDEAGCVALNGVKSTSGFAKGRFAIKSIADTLPAGTLQRATAQINEGLAMARYNPGSTMLPGLAVQECEQYVDETTGLPGFKVKLVGTNNDPVNVPGATAVPPVKYKGFDLGTPEGVRDFLNSV